MPKIVWVAIGYSCVGGAPVATGGCGARWVWWGGCGLGRNRTPTEHHPTSENCRLATVVVGHFLLRRVDEDAGLTSTLTTGESRALSPGGGDRGGRRGVGIIRIKGEPRARIR